MEFIIDTAELQRIIGLLGVSAVVNTVEPSGRIYIEAKEDNTVLFLSNNGSIGISITSDKAIVSNPGTVSIVYGKIKSFVSPFTPWNDTFGAKEFHFKSTQEGTYVTVENIHENGEKSKGSLKLDTYNIFSIQLPEIFGKADFVLNSAIFKSASSKVLYAIDPGDGRPFITGMNIRFDDEFIYFAGTNGRQLSEYKVKNISESVKGSHILRHDFIMGLRRALSDGVQIFFELEDNKIKAKFDDIYFWGKLIIGDEYPDYTVNLDSFTYVIKLNKDVLTNILMPFNDVFNSEDYNRITFQIEDKKLKIFNDYAFFEYEEEVNHDSDFVVDVDGKSMLETIGAIKDDVLLLKFSDEEGCLVFDSGNFEDQKGLITPIRRR